VSESVRDLVVSISLNSGNFTGEMRGISTAVKQAEANFARAAAGVKGFGASTAGMQAKITQLTSQLSLQQMAVTKHSAALQANRTKLTAETHAQASLAGKIQAVKAAYDIEVKATGKSSASSQALGNELTKLNGQYAATTKQITNTAAAIQKGDLALTEAQAAVKLTEAELNKATVALKTHGSAWGQAMMKVSAAGDAMIKAGGKMSSIGKTLTTGVTLPIALLGAGAIKAAIDWESAFTGVEKTVDGTAAEMAALKQGIQEMSEEMPSSANAIAAVAANAGQLGIKTSAILGFSSAMLDLSNSTNLTSEDAAMSLAQFANIMQMNQGQFRNLGSSIVELGNNYATTEADIVAMGQRLAGAGNQVKLSEADIMGIATAMASLGIEAEAGGSAMSKVMLNIDMAAAKGEKGIAKYAKVAGVSAKDFIASWKSDPAAALTSFIAGLGNVEAAGGNVALTLESLGYSEIRVRDALLRLTGGGEVMASAVATSNRAWEENVALTNEAGKRYGTTASRLSMLKNKVVNTGAAFGEAMVPALQDAIDKVSGLVEGFASMDDAQKANVIKWAAMAAAIGPALSILGKVTTGIGKLTKGFSKFFSTPWMWQAAIVVGAAAAAYAIWDIASGAKAARDAIAGMNGVASDFKNNNASTIYDTGNDAMARFGVSREDFAQDESITRTWLERISEAWAAGKTKTKDTVAVFVEEYTASSDEIRDAIKARKDTLLKLGITSGEADRLGADAKLVDKWDKEIARILEGGRFGKLSAKQQARLNELMTLRADLRIKYIEDGETGYEGILAGIENEKARARAAGTDVSVDVYADAVTAASQGQNAYNEALNTEYDTRRASLLLMKDTADKTAALAALDTWYSENRQKNADEYKKTLAELALPILNDPGLTGQKDKIAQLYAALQGFDGSSASLTGLEDITKDLDEGKLASLLSTLTALQTAGIGADTLGFDPAAVLAQYQSISDIVASYPTQLAGLGTIFKEALPDEVKEVLVTLKLDEAEKAWTDFAEGKGSLDTLVNLTATAQQTVLPTEFILGAQNADGSYSVNIKGENNQILPTAFFSEVDADGNVTVKMKAQAAGQIGTSDMYLGEANEDGTYKIKLKSQSTGQLADTDFVAIENKDGTFTIKMTGQVNGTLPGSSFVVGAQDADGNYVIGLAASVTLSPLDQQMVSLWKSLPGNQAHLTGDVSASVGVTLGPDWKADLDTLWATGKLAAYGTDGLPIEVTPDVINALDANDLVVGVDADGTYHIIVKPQFDGSQGGVDKIIADLNVGNDQPGMEWYPYDVSTAQWLKSLQGVIDLYPGVKQIADLLGQKNAGQGITDWTTGSNLFQSIQAAQAAGGLFAGIQSGAAISGDGVQYLKDLGAALKFIQDENIDSALPSEIMKIFDALGIEYNADDLAASFDAMLAVLAEKTAALKKASDDAATAAAVAAQAAATPEQSADILNMANDVQAVINALNSGDKVPDGALGTLRTLAMFWKDMVPGEQTTKLTDSIKGIFDAMGIEYDPNNLQDALDKLVLEATPKSEGAGSQVSAGIGTGMKGYGFDADAATVASELVGALNTALDIASPSGKTKPVGYQAGAGVGAGLASYKGMLEADAKSFGSILPIAIGEGITAGASSALTAIKSMYAQLIAEARVQAALLKSAMEGTSGGGAGTTGGSGDGGGGRTGKGAVTNNNSATLNLNGSYGLGAVDLYALRQELLAMNRRTAAGYGKA
jgi:TP901 family phage tail tape measure protein